MLKNANKKEQKGTQFFCEKCNFNTSHKPNYERHLLTIKHRSVSDANKMLIKRTKKNHIKNALVEMFTNTKRAFCVTKRIAARCARWLAWYLLDMN